MEALASIDNRTEVMDAGATLQEPDFSLELIFFRSSSVTTGLSYPKLIQLKSKTEKGSRWSRWRYRQLG